MSKAAFVLEPKKPWIVGSFGCLEDLINTPFAAAKEQCDVVEIRLDILRRDGWNMTQKPWNHLRELPLLFTARCRAEGGVLDDDAAARQEMVNAVIEDASLMDIELASAESMKPSLELCQSHGVAWIASHHRFDQMPTLDDLRRLRDQARAAGAAAFKVAAMLAAETEIELLEKFQAELDDFAVSSMGMGPLAPASRVRCALAGSVLNYGYIGQAPTAPGQWPAGTLRRAVRGES